MAKAFFYQDANLNWWGGTFKADGVTPKVESRIPAGLYRDRWQVVNGVTKLTIINANNLGELAPFRDIPITDVASDNIGTPYASKAAFITATKDFFFRVGGGGVSSDGFLYLPTTISSKGIRIGERTGWVIAYDRILTATGFDGTEGVDWENFDGIEIVTI